MEYSRTILRGEDKVFGKMIAEQLGIPYHTHKKHKRKHHVHGPAHHRRKTRAMERRLGMKKPKLGSGGRFAAFKRRLESKGYSSDSAGAVAASAGRKKYGDKKMAKLSAIGRRRAAKVNDHDGDE